MIRWLVGLSLLLVVLSMPPAGSVGHQYAPATGDSFHYYETVLLNDGSGANYTGYTENTFVNGSISVTGIAKNGTVNASYQNSNSWSNDQGASEKWNSAGTFGFSPTSFEYVNGTDNQTGYTNPVYVWFYMNNKLAEGTTFYLLNSQMAVVSTDYSYDLGGTRYVETIFAEGNGSYERDDAYGMLTATYNWKAYFDPGTGYIVGYLYTERDSNSTDAFTWTDTLSVTSTSYALTSAAALPHASPPDSVSYTGVVVAIVFVVIIILVVVWLVARSRRNRPRQLPQHAAPGNIGFGAPPPPFAPMGGAPPIHLTPSQQPIPQVVLRETVKVKCPYCGTLVDVTDKVCPNCGAPLST